MDDGKVIIKKGSVSLNMEKGDLFNIDQTGDGLSINIKGKMQLYVTDENMPLRVKELIIAATKFPKGSVTIDLDNYVNPTKVEL
jgi:hypothetical protein